MAEDGKRKQPDHQGKTRIAVPEVVRPKYFPFIKQLADGRTMSLIGYAHAQGMVVQMDSIPGTEHRLADKYRNFGGITQLLCQRHKTELVPAG